VLFAEKAVIRPRNGVSHLQFRMANWRTNLIVEAHVSVYLLMVDRTSEGEVTRTPVEVELVRTSTPFFFLTFTAMHRIDEKSPFFGEGAIDRLRAAGAQLFVNLTGYDQTLGQTVHAYREYAFDNILENARFVDVIHLHPDGTREIDFSKFHEVELLPEITRETSLAS
jgi:inward rectifier potassium channel